MPKKQQMQDITGLIGPLYHSDKGVTHLMYSYNSAAYLFWQGFYEGLIAQGFGHQQALDEMTSKGVRRMFDARGEEVTELGRAMAKGYTSYLKSD